MSTGNTQPIGGSSPATAGHTRGSSQDGLVVVTNRPSIVPGSPTAGTAVASPGRTPGVGREASIRLVSPGSSSTADSTVSMRTLMEEMSRLWAMSGEIGAGASLAASKQPVGEPLDTACARLEALGLIDHTDSPEKLPKGARPLGLGFVYSNVYCEFADAMKRDVPPAPTSKRAIEAKNSSMNKDIKTIKDINDKLGPMHEAAKKLSREAAPKRDQTRAGNSALGWEAWMPGTGPSKVFDRFIAEMEKTFSGLEELGTLLATQCQRLQFFPEMTRPDNPISKRQEFRSKLLSAVARWNNINGIRAHVASPYSPISVRPLLALEVKRELAITKRLSPPIRKAVSDLEKEPGHAEQWSDIAALVEFVKLNAMLPDDAEDKQPEVAMLYMYSDIADRVSVACEAQFKILDGTPRYRVLNPLEMGDESGRLAGLNELIGYQEFLLRAYSGTGSPVDDFCQELTQIKRVTDASINEIHQHLRDFKKSVEESLTPDQRTSIAKASEQLRKAAIAFTGLVPAAQAIRGKDSSAKAMSQVQKLLRGLEMGRFIAQAMSDVGQTMLGKDWRDELAAPIARPKWRSDYAKAQEAKLHAQADASKPIQASTRRSLGHMSFQDIHAMTAPQQERANRHITAGKNELGRYNAIMSKFRSDDFLAADALANAVSHFSQACALRDGVLETLEVAPRDKYSELNSRLPKAQTDWDEAHRLVQETQEFMASPVSKRPTEEVFEEMESKGLVTLHRPVRVQLPGGGQAILVKIDRQGAESLWLRLHLWDDYPFTRLENVTLDDCKVGEGLKDCIAIKTDFYNSLQSNRDWNGDPTPRIPWRAEFGFGVFQRALGSTIQ